MEPIKLELWKPKEDDPRFVERVGQRSGVEVFEELKQRLDGMGLLPDEYFDLDTDWQDGKLIPQDADIFVTTDYGVSEGVFLDAFLRWYEGNECVTRSFFTGKTLGETGADMDRMFLISSAITKAFHGDYGQHARYIKPGSEELGGDIIVNLTPDEQKIFAEALLERRERLLDQADGTEQLLRRMVGSITEYMNVVGERPLRISDYDKASLAIRDGEFQAFKDLLPRAGDHTGELLIEAAGRCGEVGRKMCIEILAFAGEFTNTTYAAATQEAVKIGDTERVKFLMEQAQHTVADLDPAYYGQVIDYAYSENNGVGRGLIYYAPDEWLATAPPSLLVRTTTGFKDLNAASRLIEKGLRPGMYAESVLQNLTGTRRDAWMAEYLLKEGMEVERNDFRALNVCVRNGAVDCAKLLLERGMDFDSYLAWKGKNDGRPAPEGVIEELTQYAQTLAQQQEQAATPEEAPAQGQTMGGPA